MGNEPQTLKNLAKAFIGECQARNKYTFYASIAKQEGYEQIAEVFRITAENELEHAEVLYKLLVDKASEGIIDTEAKVPISLGNTIENLRAAMDGEKYEFSVMYPEFAKTARNEGFNLIAAKFRLIAVAEGHHMRRFEALLNELLNKSMYKKKAKVLWICRKCGYIHEGTEPPVRCPLCGHSRGYFQLLVEKY